MSATLDEVIRLAERYSGRAGLHTGPDPNPFERLELGHIAAVIDAGHWIEP